MEKKHLDSNKLEGRRTKKILQRNSGFYSFPFPLYRFYSSPNVRYHPTTHSNIKVLRGTTAAPSPPSPSPSPPLSGVAAVASSGSAAAAPAGGPSAKENLEHLSIVFNLLVSIIDHMIR